MRLTDPDIREQIAPYTRLELIPILCGECNQPFDRTKKAIQDALNKGRLNAFCSRACQSSFQNTQVKTNCAQCHVPISRKQFEFKKSTNHFCSNSCSATFNNRRIKRIQRHCQQCNKQCGKHSAHCSNQCYQDTVLEQKIASGVFSAKTAKRWLLKQGHTCSSCKNTDWLGQPIALELDHIDGNHTNNTLSNLRLLCPNCHAQTPTYKGKNKGKGRSYRRQRYAEGKTY